MGYRHQVLHGDCLDRMAELEPDSIDAIVTDPPYGLGFMGKAWDELPPGREWADACLRVLKPGGHLLAFGGTRTWHRLAVAVEDAGFEIRDSIFWHYGSGFPKSHNVSKSLGDKVCQCEAIPYSHDGNVHGMRDSVQSSTQSPCEGEEPDMLTSMQRSGEGSRVGDARPQGAEGENAGKLCGVSHARGEEPSMEGWRDVPEGRGELRRAALCAMPGTVADDGPCGRVHHGTPPCDGGMDGSTVAPVGSGEPHQPRPEGQSARESRAVPVERGSQAWRGWPVCGGCSKPRVPAGLGTALKPATEPVVVARKPLSGTVAANVLAHGTGALNIGACRIATDEPTKITQRTAPRYSGTTMNNGKVGGERSTIASAAPAGRWPANVVLDDTTAGILDQQSGIATSKAGGSSGTHFSSGAPGVPTPDRPRGGHNDQGGASRFFYVAKAPKRERPNVEGVQHPTVKPLALMRWLVRLVTPPGGVVLDPFAGSGTTVEAALLEGFDVIGIEREPSYLPLIEARIERVGLMA